MTKILSQIRRNNIKFNYEEIINYIEGKLVTVVTIYQIESGKISKVWFGGSLVK